MVVKGLIMSTLFVRNIELSEILGSHGGECGDYALLGCDTTYFVDRYQHFIRTYFYPVDGGRKFLQVVGTYPP